MSRKTWAASVIRAAVAVGLLSGCQASVTTASIPKAKVVQQIKDQIAKAPGGGDQPSAVECPSDLKAEVGATLRCTLTYPDKTVFGSTVKVTSLDGDQANFSLTVDSTASAGPGASSSSDATESTTSLPATSTALAVSRADLEAGVSDQLTRSVGQRPKKVTCPSDLPARAGATLRCTLTDGADGVYGLTVRITSVQGGKTDYDITVDNAPVAPSAS